MPCICSSRIHQECKDHSDKTINQVAQISRVVFGLSDQLSRSYLVIAAAIVMAGVLISASLFVAIGQSTKTVTGLEIGQPTKTVIGTTTTTSTVTFTMSAGQPISAGSVETADITIGGSPGAIAVNPNASRIYVADGSSLTVIDASSHAVIANITLPASSNNGIAVDDNTNMVYVLVDGGIAEVNGSTNKVVGELPVNFGYQSLAYNPSTHVLYGSPETQAGGLVGVDARTGAIVANISLGFWANSITVDPYTNMIYAVGCANSFVCGSEVSFVNGTSETLVTTVHLDSAYYSKVTMDSKTNVVYISGEAQLAALNGISGEVIYNSYPQTCGPFLNMADIPSSNQVLAVLQNYDYLMVYDGATVTLANMYSFSSSPNPSRTIRTQMNCT